MNSIFDEETSHSKPMLHVRILRRDETGFVRDSTHDKHQGLAWLQGAGDNAVSALARIQHLVQTLADAAEDRSDIPVYLVRHVLDELTDELADYGDLGWYVRSMQEFFNQAEAES